MKVLEMDRDGLSRSKGLNPKGHKGARRKTGSLTLWTFVPFWLKPFDYFRSAAIRWETSTHAARRLWRESKGMPSAAPAAADAIVVMRDARERSDPLTLASNDSGSEGAGICEVSSLLSIASSVGWRQNRVKLRSYWLWCYQRRKEMIRKEGYQ